eukprot:Blabericola_migrator_1__3111@NODE_1905_length_3581_cov_73_525327_g1219_i0_p1_GENE_NODE_1905_length_3581_cov_73_525327_g1219_i0NODE_1905_length_3581_cov_73_525327_g1219_i0_p1_ORF_typecomplete_len962_score117_64Voltage_CLC/PF00654_20/1_1e03Voltage_CLC/PF00654_20/1_6e102CBS/PF00571_28/0_00039CBS/PF00571_28/0_62Cytochrom_B558a/PF05038_13/0_11Ost5/PF05251_12/1_2Ost5/PF05251_12/1_3e04Ost5/PF05251_12/4_4e03_NODE_1905_length_3581_cov_73_525327_g1219_i06403525
MLPLHSILQKTSAIPRFPEPIEGDSAREALLPRPDADDERLTRTMQSAHSNETEPHHVEIQAPLSGDSCTRAKFTDPVSVARRPFLKFASTVGETPGPYARVNTLTNVSQSGSRKRHYRQPTPDLRTPIGWRNWHKRAFRRLRAQTLSVSPGSMFAHAVTVDLSVSKSEENRSGVGTPDGEPITVVARAKSRAVSFFEEIEGWVLAAFVGACTAASAAWVEFVLEHLSDLRFGHCKGMAWLHRDFCCGSKSAVDLVGNRCLAAATGGIHLPRDHVDWDSRLADIEDPFRNGAFAVNPQIPDPLKSFGRLPPTIDERAEWVPWSQTLGLHSFVSVLDPLFYVWISVLLAVCAAVLCKRIAPAAGGSGIAELKTILGGFSLRNVLTPWTLVIKVIGLAMAVPSGLGLGKEGPMVHVGSCFADLASRLSWTRRPTDNTKKMALISAGAAAGVSTAFGAPVGGVLFALEEVSTYFPPSTLYKTLMCSVIASLVLKRTNPSSSGNGTVFQLDAIALQGRWEIVELVPFVLLAAAGGVLGACFIKLNLRLSHWRARSKKIKEPRGMYEKLKKNIMGDAVLEVFVIALLAASMNYFVPMLRWSSTMLMTHLFTRCGRQGIGFDDIYSLCTSTPSLPGGTDDTPRYQHNVSDEMLRSLGVALVSYFINTLLTLGLAVPAGIFVPCLTIGAISGRIAGLLTIRADRKFGFMNCNDCIHPGVYSLLGAVAVLGGVTRMTVSLVVIAFEMTGGLGYIVPFMIVTLVAKWTAELIQEPSVYDCYIRLKRFPFLHVTPLKSDREVALGKTATQVMDRDIVCISTSQPWTVGMAKTLIKEFQFSTYPVVSDVKTKTLKGVIHRRKLVARLHELANDPFVTNKTLVMFVKERSSKKIESDTPESDDYEVPMLDFTSLVESVPMQVNPKVSLLEVHHLFLQLGLTYLLFTDRGALKGILTKKSFLSRLERLRGEAKI